MSVKKLHRFPQKGDFGQLHQYDSLLTTGSCPGFVLTCCQYDIMPAVLKANFVCQSVMNCIWAPQNSVCVDELIFHILLYSFVLLCCSPVH